jgi:hypothetical protein
VDASRFPLVISHDAVLPNARLYLQPQPVNSQCQSLDSQPVNSQCQSLDSQPVIGQNQSLDSYDINSHTLFFTFFE